MTVRPWLYDGQTAGTAISGTLAGTGAYNPVVDSGGSATYQTDTPYQGSSYARFSYPASGATGAFQGLSPAASAALHSWTLAFRLRSDITAVTVNSQLAQFRTSGGALYSIRIVWTTGTPTIHLFAGSTDLGQVGGVTINDAGTTWYRVTGVVNGTTGAYEIRLRSGADDTLYGSALTGTNAGMVGTINAGTTSGSAGLRVGVAASFTSQALVVDVDDVRFDDGGTSELPKPGVAVLSTTYRWNGSAYVALNSYRWGGSAYVALDRATP
jgi:hypothetical protein